MFKSATIKLTFWYVLLTMGLSLVFSGVLYQLSTHELSEALRNQYSALIDTDHDGDNHNYVAANELNARSQHLIQNLIYFNLLILAGASISSYILARRTLRPIEVAHQAQIRFSAEASHELRTPLAAMKADTESVLMQPTAEPAILRQTLEANLIDIQKLEKLTNHLLELSRHKSLSSITKQSIDLEPIVSRVVALFEKQAKANKITIKTDVKSVAVIADDQSMQQLITIILDNAVKYSLAQTSVSINLTTKDRQAVLTVTDQGIGIRSDDLPHIFEHFYRSKQTDISQKRIAGYGLGLPLAKDIVELHNGTINITSQAANGTIVKIILPLA